MRALGASRTSLAPGGVLAGPWVKNELWRRARAVPTLDLRFADNKSLTDAVTGQSLVTFTRASSGTYVDSQGVIRPAVTNLLLQSEEFGTTWVAASASISADVLAAPNGTPTADLYVPNSGVAISGNGNFHNLRQAITVVNGTTYTLSAYVKAGGYNVIRFGLSSQVNLVNNYSDITVNLGTLSVTQTSGTGSVVPVGNGWFRVTATGTATSTTGHVVFVVADGGTANGTSGIYIWGAQLEQSSTVGEYIPTGATINSAPRFDHNPVTGESLGLLVEESRTNLLVRSEEFDNASWGKINVTVTANAATAPNSTTTAGKIVETVDTGGHLAVQSVAGLADSTLYTFSVFAKAAERSWIAPTITDKAGNLNRVWFDLSTGNQGATNGTVSSFNAIPLINGWYRLIVTASSGTGGSSVGVRVSMAQADNTASYTGDGTSGLFVWGAQLE